MLTPKRTGPESDFLSEEPSHPNNELVGVRQRKPLSQILREEREHRNLSLREVARLTRIPLNYLELLEGEGDTRLVPDSLYLIAALRGYVAFLGINPGAALTRFIAEVEQGPTGEEKAGGTARPTPWLLPFPPLRSWVSPRMLLLLLPLGLLALLGYYSEPPQGPRPKEDKVALLPAPVESPPPPPSELPPPDAAPAPSAAPSEAGQSEALAPPPPVAPSGSAATEAAPPTVAAPVVPPPSLVQKPPASPLHHLRVQAKARTWLHVTIDNQPMKRLFLRPGQALQWAATKRFILSLGDAGAVKVSLDGRELPPLGKAGQMALNVHLPAPRGGQRQAGRKAGHRPAA
jgi:cytoskeleton protein RodZ